MKTRRLLFADTCCRSNFWLLSWKRRTVDSPHGHNVSLPKSSYSPLVRAISTFHKINSKDSCYISSYLYWHYLNPYSFFPNSTSIPNLKIQTLLTTPKQTRPQKVSTKLGPHQNQNESPFPPLHRHSPSRQHCHVQAGRWGKSDYACP